MKRFVWKRPVCICDVCVERRSPGEQEKSEPHVEAPKEFCCRCGSPMQTFKIQCLAGNFNCYTLDKIC